ncbi:MAG TPA: flagellar biosynthesis protein FlhB [Candidatus Krumholzibacteria bacterium]|nr:flagellar biosynthesis protein FlhB [Candidatus Krumholzibacteria bacterium]HPD71611.1 flagellar biosynthesis protein FlhB [Candidatus Krumholzibacteria bacterium]HRY41456.1 flagellar biosynthesis protein FlhB [Candidatus Krumholzibacteria bacterium]
MAEDTAGERTEKATPRRREKAREKGQVARSSEVNSFFTLLVGTAALATLSGYLLDLLARNASYLLGQAHFLGPSNLCGVRYLLVGNAEDFFWILAPVCGLVLLAGVGASLLQVGVKLTPSAMAFQWGRLNPVSGAKRLFDKRTLFELVKNVLKVGVISWLAWLVIRSLLPELNASAALPADALLALGRHGYLKLMATLLGFLAVLAILDWTFHHYQHEAELRMSRQELKEEYREFEGDPQIKARVRALQIEASRRRMLAEVPRADVVVTNPTHFAVALKYTPGQFAPVVVAKGADYLAQKIREVARQARVPVIENRAMARALYAEVDVGHPIPERLFQAVAEILAYVYRLRKA